VGGCGWVGGWVSARVHRRVVLFGRVFLVALLQERNEILAAKIGDACAQAEPGKAVVAVLGTLSLSVWVGVCCCATIFSIYYRGY